MLLNNNEAAEPQDKIYEFNSSCGKFVLRQNSYHFLQCCNKPEYIFQKAYGFVYKNFAFLYHFASSCWKKEAFEILTFLLK